MRRDHVLEGCIGIVGGIIKQAIKDYQNDISSNLPQSVKDDATNFLFYEDKLESFLERFSLREHLNCDFIRKQAKNRLYILDKDD